MTTSSIISKTDVKEFVYNKAKTVYKFLGIINRPEINIILIGLFFVSIIIYSFVNNKYKRIIAEWVSTPLITSLILMIVIIISYVNFPLGILLLIGYFIIIYPNSNDATSIYYTNENASIITNIGVRSNNNYEHFENNNSTSTNNSATKGMEDKEKDDELADSIKNSITQGIKDAKKKNDDDLKALMLQNSKMKLKNEKKNNKKNNNSSGSGSSGSGSGSGNSDNNDSEKVKKVEKRKFNPSNQDDTNLMITKEMLNDMINRIEYKYEDTQYLKKYLRHRIEDIIETNDLLDDDE